MPSYHANPFVPLGEFGHRASVLNESFLVGATVTFCRPLELDDYARLGYEHAFAVLAESEASLPAPRISGDHVIVERNLAPLFVATGEVAEFFEEGDALFVRFTHEMVGPTGDVVTIEKLVAETTVVFQP